MGDGSNMLQRSVVIMLAELCLQMRHLFLKEFMQFCAGADILRGKGFASLPGDQ